MPTGGRNLLFADSPQAIMTALPQADSSPAEAASE